MNLSFPRHVSFAPRAQRGVVLVVALIFLLLITILAMAASGTSMMQLRLVGGLRSSQLADFGAESALRGAEWRIWTASNTSPMACTTTGPICYKYDASSTNADVEKFRGAKGWDATASTTYSPTQPLTTASTDNTFKLTKDPVYLIEDLGVELPPGSGTQHESGQSSPGTGNTSVDSHVYRITARSTGANDNTVRTIETTFAAKAN
ncbi:PilX N-terminal domain-containing pilus assembly protein [Luteibacter sp. 329MFSha]|uniref:pilus assembly PilX family protein n=1 Tax=Luteibacter sp. 329MFSha TaxID=1798239 RepID=UPI0008C32FEA|nr:PilX N-terminal domain-containing pilus assembly protein [Luteibacter sp. 329MFSha]SEV85241.1 type IV pilus assembly protein PilX [Luteibacter sp. 329MFSha]